jgi:inhibitor of KinA
MNSSPPYKILPLGDTAAIIDFGNSITEEINDEVMRRFHYLQANPIVGIIDLIPAYSSLVVCYDIVVRKKITPQGSTVFEGVKKELEGLMQQQTPATNTAPRHIKIPVCYEEPYAKDLKALADIKNISINKIIQLHTEKEYKVYMLGFLPGFAYMGIVDEHICTPRKQQPENVAAGSVGIAGNQTGIYPVDSPGGWQIIGRTPLQLFNKEKEIPVLLQPGDIVSFYPITSDEFKKY